MRRGKSSLGGAGQGGCCAWAHYLNKVVELFGEHSDVVFAQHHWPTWGNEAVIAFLEAQRDAYKFLNDQTLRLINKGHTAAEIAELLQFPPELDQLWHLRGYYGTVLARARGDLENGDYRWVAEAVNHVVFADPANTDARDLLADCYEQLGYQAEAGTWRNIYLSGAQELRDGIQKIAAPTAVSPELLATLPIELIFDYLGVLLDGSKAAGKTITINLDLTDSRQQYVLQLKNSVLNYFGNRQAKDADLTLRLSSARLAAPAHAPRVLRRCAHRRRGEDRGQPAGAGRPGRAAGHFRLLVQHRGALRISCCPSSPGPRLSGRPAEARALSVSSGRTARGPSAYPCTRPAALWPDQRWRDGAVQHLGHAEHSRDGGAVAGGHLRLRGRGDRRGNADLHPTGRPVTG